MKSCQSYGAIESGEDGIEDTTQETSFAIMSKSITSQVNPLCSINRQLMN